MNKHFLLISLLVIITVTGCWKPSSELPSTASTTLITYTVVSSPLPTSVPVVRTVIVFAAASLTDAFEEIGKDFENANPGVTVRFNFAGSQILRTQLEQGALADVFASADHKNMDFLVADNLLKANAYQDFVSNKLIVILPASNPGKVETLVDLSKIGLKLILGDSSVPAGNYARQILTKMNDDPLYGSDFSKNVLANVVSNETDVKQVVTKVELGEGDAGIVYLSDAIAASNLVTIAIPDKFNVTAHYPIATLTNAPDPKLAQAFIAYIMSSNGQTVMMKWGFSPVTQ
jgi:molybdate transport system substrate-binding protein